MPETIPIFQENSKSCQSNSSNLGNDNNANVVKFPTPEHQLTLVYPRARDGNLRKQYWPDGRTLSATNVRQVSFASRGFNSLSDLHAILIQQRKTGTAIIMGQPVVGDDYVSGGIPRQKAGDDHGVGRNRTQGFKDVPRAYLVMDVDDVPTPENQDWLDDPEAAIEQVICDNLHPSFHDVSFVWHWSGGHGIGGIWTGQLDLTKMRFRLYFLLNKPLTEGPRRSWLKSLKQNFPHLDPALAGAVQMNYIGRPVFHDGMGDPLEGLQLSGHVERGEDFVVTPAPNRMDEQKMRKVGPQAGNPYAGQSRDATEALHKIGAGNEIRSHLFATISMLVRDRKSVDGEEIEDVAESVAGELRALVSKCEPALRESVAAGNREWPDVESYLESGVVGIARWCLENPLGESVAPEELGISYPINTVSLEESNELLTGFMREFREDDIGNFAVWKHGRDEIIDERIALQNDKKLKGKKGIYEPHWDILTGWHTRELRKMSERDDGSGDAIEHDRLLADPAALKEWATEREIWRVSRVDDLSVQLFQYPEPPPAKLVHVTPGAGKTHLAITQLLIENPSEGFDSDIDMRVGYLQPTHALARQTSGNIEKLTVANSAVHKGFLRPVNDDEDPNAKGIERMCKRPADLRAANSLGSPIFPTLCRKGGGKEAVYCPFFDECYKNKNRKEVSESDAPVAMHAGGFTQKPKEVGALDGLVIDEDPTEAGIGSKKLSNIVKGGLALDHFESIHAAITVNARGDIGESDKARAKIEREDVVTLWGYIREACEYALQGTNDEAYLAYAPLTQDALECTENAWGNPISVDRITAAIRWHDDEIKKAESGLWPNVEGKARDAINKNIKKMAGNHRKRSAILRGIKSFMALKDHEGQLVQESGNLLVVVDHVKSKESSSNDSGDAYPMVKIIHLKAKQMAKSWTGDTAVMVMSATPAATPLLSSIIGREVESFGRIDVENAEGVTVRWIRDAGLTSKKLALGGKGPIGDSVHKDTNRPKDKPTRKRRDMARIIRMRQKEFGEILVVAKDGIIAEVRRQFQGQGWSVEGISFVNWANVEGMNDFEDYRYMCCLGTKDVGSDEIIMEANAITGVYHAPDDTQNLAEWRNYGLQMRDGSVEGLWGAGYGNPTMQALYESHVVGKIIQAIYRLRLSRPKDHKRLVEVFANVAAPIVVDEVVDFDDLAMVALFDEVTGRCVSLRSATGLAESCPDLFANRHDAGVFLDWVKVLGGQTFGTKCESLSIELYKETLTECPESLGNVVYTVPSHVFAVTGDEFPSADACKKYLARNPIAKQESWTEYSLKLDGPYQRECVIYLGDLTRDEAIPIIQQQQGKRVLLLELADQPT